MYFFLKTNYKMLSNGLIMFQIYPNKMDKIHNAMVRHETLTPVKIPNFSWKYSLLYVTQRDIKSIKEINFAMLETGH